MSAIQTVRLPPNLLRLSRRRVRQRELILDGEQRGPVRQGHGERVVDQRPALDFAIEDAKVEGQGRVVRVWELHRVLGRVDRARGAVAGVGVRHLGPELGGGWAGPVLLGVRIGLGRIEIHQGAAPGDG
ncbi:uncharacterized protein PG986_000170 [Apiospora aurea]|uniref:Uncharacterized protein n=1 Tax=Apiospora aurea TaxID=335848 RepID=A0ABR1QT93_9PEZI